MNIRDIAAAANVSVATVSKIMNHKDSEISEKTRQRVLDVIREYQYTPYSNLKATLDKGRSQMIAFLFEEKLFSQDFILGLEREVSRMGYSLIIYSLADPVEYNLRKYMQLAATRKIEGIFLGLSDSALAAEASVQNMSHIPMASLSPCLSDQCTTFHLDYSKVAEKSVQELLRLGHKKIGCLVTDAKSTAAASCITGYRKAIAPYASYGVGDNYVLPYDLNQTMLAEGVHRWVRSNVTAIFCQNKFLAGFVYTILKEANYFIPYDLSVICGEQLRADDYFTPELTTCSLPAEEIFPAAVNYLLNRIEINSNSSVRTYSFEPQLDHRGSTAPLSVTSKQILVVGNCSTDYMLQLDHIPAEGEMSIAGNMTTIPGGKAVVQAIGAGKLDGNVHILGCIGDDIEGQNIVNSLKDYSVHTESLTVVSSLPTGRAYIFSAPNTSTVISYPGANTAYTKEHLTPHRHLFQSCDYCLLSTELDPDLINQVVRSCERNNLELFLKPSSPTPFPDELYSKVTYCIPNETELHILVPQDGSITEKAEILYQKGCKNVIVTLGKKGCYLRNAEYARTIPAGAFHHSDSTGAANCFIAALAVALSKGNSLLYGICYATYAAGISVTQPGIQTSFPDRKLLEIYLDEIQEMYRNLTER
ncbi:MAG: substrate-binding domain-containing protein, partial [Blautia sp.]|nr:substrate-binding domain-containing protein [Blautia sp.]